MDRNLLALVLLPAAAASLSARRAWIEMLLICSADSLVFVALRKESVDRNFDRIQWHLWPCVALRKESVDRNLVAGDLYGCGDGRSPQGERG